MTREPAHEPVETGPAFKAMSVDAQCLAGIDRLPESLPDWRLEAAQIRAGRVASVVSLAQSDNMRILHVVCTGAFHLHGHVPQDCITLLQLADGRSLPTCRGQPLRPLDLEVLPGDAPIDYVNTGDCSLFVLSIESERFGLAMASAFGHDWQRASPHGRLGLHGMGEKRALLAGLSRKLRAARRWPWLLSDAHARRLWEHSTVRDLALAARSCIDQPPPPRRAQAAAIAEAYMRNQAFRPVGVSELATAIGINERTLYLGFRERYAMSPVAYARAMRLNGARRDLCRALITDTVTEIALRWGFAHLGRFASDYRSFFGEPPSATRLNALAATAASAGAATAARSPQPESPPSARTSREQQREKQDHERRRCA